MERRVSTSDGRGTLLFVHIPETAGTTFVTLMLESYKQSAVWYISASRRTLGLEVESLAWTSVLNAIGGHHPYGFGSCPEIGALVGRPERYATFLRDPVARVVSHYNHVVNSRDPVHRDIARKHPTVESFLDHKWGRNVQAFFLSGWKARWIERAPISAASVAIENLCDGFAAFGLTERFDESLLLFADAFGWDLPAYTRRNLAAVGPRNVRVEDLSDVLVDRIREANLADVAISEAAREMLDERLGRIPNLAGRLAAYRRRLTGLKSTSTAA